MIPKKKYLKTSSNVVALENSIKIIFIESNCI